MKKILLLCGIIALSACATTTDAGNGLVRLDSEPTDCEFLYTINTKSTTYNITDAYDYLEKAILEHDGIGDSYYVVDDYTMENAGAVFGPKNTYKFVVKVYNCNK